jgi:DNA-directed RNA polymerase alpha subunit
MKKRREHFMKTGSAYGKNVFGGRRLPRGRCFIRRQTFRTTPPIENVRFVTRIRNALNAVGMKTVGDVREVSDAVLLSLPDFGSSSLSYLREALGLPSTDGLRPKSEKPT